MATDLSITEPTIGSTDWGTDVNTNWSKIETSLGQASGQVAFGNATAGTGLTSDSTLAWDNTNKRLGIGTSSPAVPLHVLKAGTQLRIGYDASIYSEFYTTSSGELVVTLPSGYLGGVEMNTGNTPTWSVRNNDSGTGGARYNARVAGAGDPFYTAIVDGGLTWAWGIDNSDGDKWKLSKNGVLGTNDYLTLDSGGNVVINNAALATSATDGFLYIPTCAGTPSGTPTAYTGRVPMVYDTTNNKLYVYNGAWKGVTLA